MSMKSAFALVCLLAAAACSTATEPEWVDTSVGRAVRVRTAMRPAPDRMDPIYPEALRLERIQGNVVVHVVVDERGAVIAVERIEATKQEFADAVVAVIKTWRFRPHRVAGQPVKALCFVSHQFRLD